MPVSTARKDYDDCTAKHGRYGIPVDLADGRTFTLDPDELPRPEPETGAR